MNTTFKWLLFFTLIFIGFPGKIHPQARMDSINDSLVRSELELHQLSEKRTELFGHDMETISTTLSIAVLVFCFLTLTLILAFLAYMKKGFGDLTIKLIVVVLVLCSCLFLIVAGFSKDQITPVVGVIGTIAGYILGSNTKNSGASGDDAKP